MTLAIPKGSLVLVTGGDGFVGSWVTDEFVKQGYRVRIASIDESRSKLVKDIVERRHGQGAVEVILTPDVNETNAYAEAIKGVAAVAHLAFDVLEKGVDEGRVERDLAGLQDLLRLAADESSVKRFVYTSSIAAMTTTPPELDTVLSPRLWNDVVLDKTRKPDLSDPELPVWAYSASKMTCEKYLWSFIERASPRFVVNTVVPGYVLGPVPDEQLSRSSHLFLRGLYRGEKAHVDFMTTTGSRSWWINVKDLARLHVGATIFSDVGSKRLLGFVGKFNVNQLLDIMQNMNPSWKLADKVALEEDRSTAENQDSLEIIKRFDGSVEMSLEQTIHQTLQEAEA